MVDGPGVSGAGMVVDTAGGERGEGQVGERSASLVSILRVNDSPVYWRFLTPCIMSSRYSYTRDLVHR